MGVQVGYFASDKRPAARAAGRIRGYWRDPAYVPGELAFYYARFANCHAAMDDPGAGPASRERRANGRAAHDSGAGPHITDLDTPRELSVAADEKQLCTSLRPFELDGKIQKSLR